MMDILQIPFLVLLGGTLVLLWRWGGPDERSGGVAVLAATLLTPAAQSQGFAGPEVGIVAVDAALFACFGALSLRSSAFWPIWAAGFQLGALAVHLSAAQLPEMLPAAYAETLVIWSYPVLLTLAAGTWFEARPRARGAA
jgi:hypothetical protein